MKNFSSERALKFTESVIRDLVEKFGVATVPGSSFYSFPSQGATKVRFCFPKKMETLEQAAERLQRFKESRNENDR